MKKSTLRKLAIVFVAMFAFAGAFAQAVQDANYTITAETVLQTQGKTFRLYVDPSNVYNPNYNALGLWALDANSRWTWTYPAGLVVGTPVSGVALNQNYVEFVNPTAGGPYLVTVVESNTVVACTDAGQTKNVTIIAAPVVNITTADPAQYCGSQLVGNAVAMTFTEAVPLANAAYAFAISEVVETINPDNTLIATISTNATFRNFPTGGKLKTPTLTGVGSPYGYSFTTAVLALSGGNRTRYTYTLTKTPLVVGADGVVSAITQKSDYVGGTVIPSPFGGAKLTYVAIVNPQPVTGPIYHISNTYSY